MQINNYDYFEYGNPYSEEVIIDDMITKYPGLRLQYEKFMTVYNLVKDDYTYEEPVNDGSI